MSSRLKGTLKRANPHTIHDKFLVGYQGWFTCAGDGPPVHKGHHGWLHWLNYPIPDGGKALIDLWPDTSEYEPDELHPVPGLTLEDGSPAKLFSSRHPKTVQRHFHWMAEHGIDGAFLQRFGTQCEVDGRTEGGHADLMRLRDEVNDVVMHAAEKEGRVFAIMYDVSGVPADRLQHVIEVDWIHMMRDKRVLESPAYLREKGKPVIAIWGLGFDNRHHHPHTIRAICAFLRASTPGGAYIFAGTPTHWLNLQGDADPNPEFADIWLNEFDCISPWAVGRFHDEEGADRFAAEKVKVDMEALRKSGERGGRIVDYAPVVLPGGSHWNGSGGQHAWNDAPRQGGRFLWRQIWNVRREGARIIYGAMWDEYDEGTAFLPAVPHKRQLPCEGHFLALDEDGHDVPPDWYMRICGMAGESLRGERMIHETFPIKELQDYWSSRPRYEEDDEGASGSGSGSGSGPAGFSEWLQAEEAKEAEAEQPPPPYTLEAIEGENGPAPVPPPASTRPVSTRPLPPQPPTSTRPNPVVINSIDNSSSGPSPAPMVDPRSRPSTMNSGASPVNPVPGSNVAIPSHHPVSPGAGGRSSLHGHGHESTSAVPVSSPISPGAHSRPSSHSPFHGHHYDASASSPPSGSISPGIQGRFSPHSSSHGHSHSTSHYVPSTGPPSPGIHGYDASASLLPAGSISPGVPGRLSPHSSSHGHSHSAHHSVPSGPPSPGAHDPASSPSTGSVSSGVQGRLSPHPSSHGHSHGPSHSVSAGTPSPDVHGHANRPHSSSHAHGPEHHESALHFPIPFTQSDSSQPNTSVASPLSLHPMSSLTHSFGQQSLNGPPQIAPRPSSSSPPPVAVHSRPEDPSPGQWSQAPWPPSDWRNNSGPGQLPTRPPQHPLRPHHHSQSPQQQQGSWPYSVYQSGSSSSSLSGHPVSSMPTPSSPPGHPDSDYDQSLYSSPPPHTSMHANPSAPAPPARTYSPEHSPPLTTSAPPGQYPGPGYPPQPLPHATSGYPHPHSPPHTTSGYPHPHSPPHAGPVHAPPHSHSYSNSHPGPGYQTPQGPPPIPGGRPDYYHQPQSYGTYGPPPGAYGQSFPPQPSHAHQGYGPPPIPPPGPYGGPPPPQQVQYVVVPGSGHGPSGPLDSMIGAVDRVLHRFTR